MNCGSLETQRYRWFIGSRGESLKLDSESLVHLKYLTSRIQETQRRNVERKRTIIS